MEPERDLFVQRDLWKFAKGQISFFEENNLSANIERVPLLKYYQ